jgi:hypothetical protein
MKSLGDALFLFARKLGDNLASVVEAERKLLVVEVDGADFTAQLDVLMIAPRFSVWGFFSRHSNVPVINIARKQSTRIE